MVELVRKYCLSKPKTSESFPFDEVTLVFKVLDKIFALYHLETQRLNLKCNPEYAIELRERYPQIIPAFHMNKKHWNTVILDGNLSDEMILGWIAHSYDLVVRKMTKKQQARLNDES